jgi:heme O synthase-like polyprenyltransferase
MFGAISIFLYTSIYTPLKTMTSLSVFCRRFSNNPFYVIGLPPGEFGIEAGTLFLIQFFWQFRAIGWFCMTIMRGWFLYVYRQKKTKAQRYRLFYTPFG